MQSNILFKSLINLGVTEFDAKLYQHLLENPNYSVAQISRDFSTSRVRIYDSFKRLELQELVERQSENGSFRAVSVTRVQSKLRLKEAQTRKLSTDLDEIMPELLYNFSADSKVLSVKAYEGKDSFVRLATELIEELKPNSELLWISEGQELYDMVGFDYFISELGTRRHKKQVNVKILANYKNTLKTDLLLTREFRYLPPNFETLGTIAIAGSKIIHWNTVTPKVITINDTVMAKVYTQIFYLLWDKAEVR